VCFICKNCKFIVNSLMNGPFVNELTINLQFLHIKHAVHPEREASEVVARAAEQMIVLAFEERRVLLCSEHAAVSGCC